MRNLSRAAWLIAIMIAAGACEAPFMKAAPEGGAAQAADANQATIIFMRPSLLGTAERAAVFDVTSPENKFVGIVWTRTKVAYRTAPGKSMFMLVGETADFLQADLEAGKTYYAQVTLKLSFSKNKIGFSAVDYNELDTEEFEDGEALCELVENTPEAFAWARENMADVKKKRAEYLPKWHKKPAVDKAVLNPEDGM